MEGDLVCIGMNGVLYVEVSVLELLSNVDIKVNGEQFVYYDQFDVIEEVQQLGYFRNIYYDWIVFRLIKLVLIKVIEKLFIDKRKLYLIVFCGKIVRLFFVFILGIFYVQFELDRYNRVKYVIIVEVKVLDCVLQFGRVVYI